MIIDAVERAVVVADTYFVDDLQTIIDALGAVGAGLSAQTYIYGRRFGDDIVSDDSTPTPGLCIYAVRYTTNARRQDRRVTLVEIMLEYVMVGSDPVIVAKQVEVAGQALVRIVDRMAPSSGSTPVFGAGEQANAVTGTLDRLSHTAGQRIYAERVTCDFTAHVEEVGLP